MLSDMTARYIAACQCHPDASIDVVPCPYLAAMATFHPLEEQFAPEKVTRDVPHGEGKASKTSS